MRAHSWRLSGRSSKLLAELLEDRTVPTGTGFGVDIEEPNDELDAAFDTGIRQGDTDPTSFLGNGLLGQDETHPQFDKDYLKLSLDAGTRIGVGVEFIPGGPHVAYSASLLDRFGNPVDTELVSADDRRIPFPQDHRTYPPDSHPETYIHLTVKDDGDYYLLVQGGNFQDLVRYNVEIRVVPRVPLGPPNGASGSALSEPNDTIDQADGASPITLGPFGVGPGGVVIGEYYQSGLLGDNPGLPAFGNAGRDVDMYKFVVPPDPFGAAESTYNVNISADLITSEYLAGNPFSFLQPTPSVDELYLSRPQLRARIFDADGQDITDTLDLSPISSTTGQIFIIFPAPPKGGTYYLGLNLGGDYDPTHEGSDPGILDGAAHEIPYFISALLTPLLSPPPPPMSGIAPTSLAWDTTQGGVNFGYEVTGADVQQDVPVAFYWSHDNTFSTATDTPLSFPYTVPAGTAVGPLGPFHIDGSELANPPSDSDYLLMVIDPADTLGMFGFQAMPLQVGVSLAASDAAVGAFSKNPALPLQFSMHLDQFNTTFSEREPLPGAEPGALLQATAGTGPGGRQFEVQFTLFGSPAGVLFTGFATVDVTLTLFSTAPPSAPPDDRIGTFVTGAHHVWLNQHHAGDQVIKWSTAGFQSYLTVLGQTIPFLPTGPLEDWVDLGDPQLGLTASSSFDTIIDRAEQLIETRNADIVFRRLVLPWIAIFDPGDTDLLVTDPAGRQTGAIDSGSIVQDIPLSVYVPTIPLTVILSPEPGTYQTRVRGRTAGSYTLITGLIGDDGSSTQESFDGELDPGQADIYTSSFGDKAASLESALQLPPPASVSGPTSGIRSQTLTITASASDPAAGYRYVVDWGDGSADTVIPPTAGNGAGVSIDHAFAITGTFFVSVTAVDMNGVASSAATLLIAITDLVSPPVIPSPSPRISVEGSLPGEPPTVRVFDVTTEALLLSFSPYDASFVGGVRALAADFTGDGYPDVVTGAGAGGGPHIRIFDGRDGSLVTEFFAFDPGFRGGVSIATADVDGDGYPDLVVGAGAGGGPHVRVFSGKLLISSHGLTAPEAQLASFFAYDPSFTGGVNVTLNDFDGDGKIDLAMGTGAGGAPAIHLFDPLSGAQKNSFFLFDPNSRDGIFVGTEAGTGRPNLLAAVNLNTAGDVVQWSDGVPEVVGDFTPVLVDGVLLRSPG